MQSLGVKEFLAALDLPVPFAPELEAVYRPSKDKIVDAIAAWMD